MNLEDILTAEELTALGNTLENLETIHNAIWETRQ